VRQIAIFACYVVAAACLGVLVAIGYLLAQLHREGPGCWPASIPADVQGPVIADCHARELLLLRGQAEDSGHMASPVAGKDRL
jgi:hypothetical protein